MGVVPVMLLSKPRVQTISAFRHRKVWPRAVRAEFGKAHFAVERSSNRRGSRISVPAPLRKIKFKARRVKSTAPGQRWSGNKLACDRALFPLAAAEPREATQTSGEEGQRSRQRHWIDRALLNEAARELCEIGRVFHCAELREGSPSSLRIQ